MEYNKRFEEIDAILEEIDAKDDEKFDTEMQDKINSVLSNGKSLYEMSCEAELFSKLYSRYGWLYEGVNTEEVEEVKEINQKLSKLKLDEYAEKYSELMKYGEEAADLKTSDSDKQIRKENDNFSGANKAQDYKDPLVIDLNKNGKYTTGREEGSYFDFEGDGFAEKTSWIESGDGLLVRDINNNGKIDDGSELFGDKTILSNGKTAKNGFEALADLDSNADGIIDENDEAFEEIKVWIDENSNGIADEGELHTLKEMDIENILLNYTSVNCADNDSMVTGISIVNKKDGSTYTIGNLNFSINTTDTVSKAEIEVSDEIKEKMPQLYASGNILSLQEAMMLDGELFELVSRLCTSTDMIEKSNLMEEILLKWTGCENIEAGSRGGNIDATKLSVIEKFYGTAFVGVDGSNPNQSAATILSNLYEDINKTFKTKLLLQTDLINIVGLTKINIKNSNGEKRIDYTDVIEYFDKLTGLSLVDETIIFGYYIKYIKISNTTKDIYDEDQLKYYINKSKYSAKYIDMLQDKKEYFGTNEDDTISASSGNDKTKTTGLY